MWPARLASPIDTVSEPNDCTVKVVRVAIVN